MGMVTTTMPIAIRYALSIDLVIVLLLLEIVDFLTLSRAIPHLGILQKPHHYFQRVSRLQPDHYISFSRLLPNWLPVVYSFRMCSTQF